MDGGQGSPDAVVPHHPVEAMATVSRAPASGQEGVPPIPGILSRLPYALYV
jgi:hypothetical protein